MPPLTPAEERAQKAIRLVKERHPEAVEPSVQRVLSIDQGQIYESHLLYVVYSRPGTVTQSQPRSLVYFPPFREPFHFDNSEEFITWYAGRRSQQNTMFWSKVLDISGGVAGLLAVMITGAIVYEYIQLGGAKFDIPTPLASALGTVLGFYFGGKTKEAKAVRVSEGR